MTVRHGEATSLQRAAHGRSRSDPERLKRGPGAVLHAIVDRVVDDYAPAIEGLREDIEEVENDVFSPERDSSAERIYKLKREVLEFTRAAAPLVGPIDRLAAGHHELIHPEVREYFRDVNDHLVRVHEQLEGFRELLTSVLTANLTQVSVRQNEDVRKISAWVAIIAVPTHDRRHLRHELRAHARARVAARLPGGAGRDGRRSASGCTATSSARAGSDDQLPGQPGQSATVP